MKFQFLPKQSKIVDFLYFPKCLYQKEILEDSNRLNNYKEAIDHAYFDTLEHYKSLLAPFGKEIEIFYNRNFHDLEFADFFIKNISPHLFETSQQYLDHLLSLDQQTIKQYIINQLNQENGRETSDLTLTSNSQDISRFLENYPLDATAKWNLLLILQEPKLYLRRYVDLMLKLWPLFVNVYDPMEEEVTHYGHYLEDYLNKHGEEGLQDITNTLINEKYFLNEENLLFISALFPYTIIISDGPNNNQIYWGMKVEAAMKKIKEINVDKLNDRVQTFKYLGDKTKYEVLRHISRGITSTKEIARLTNVSSATISYHINAFLTSKIILLDNNNRKFSYVVNYKLLSEFLNDFRQDLKFPKE